MVRGTRMRSSPFLSPRPRPSHHPDHDLHYFSLLTAERRCSCCIMLRAERQDWYFTHTLGTVIPAAVTECKQRVSRQRTRVRHACEQKQGKHTRRAERGSCTHVSCFPFACIHGGTRVECSDPAIGFPCFPPVSSFPSFSSS